MNKLFFLLLLLTLGSWITIPKTQPINTKEVASFCGPGYYPDEEYYNLFAQEVIQAPKYTPFLLSYDSFYYPSKNTKNLKNENIEDWQDYLDISYENAFYLVFKSSRKEVQALLNKKPIENKNLLFIDDKFIKKHKQALLYLSYAKYLEPYMAVISKNEGYYWGDKPEHTVAELDYEAVIKVLKNSWKAEKDKELKLRYGYQLVRLAHYNLYFNDAISYFKSHVESLDYKGIMYYYALDQKAGAERGMGNFMQANYDFFQFFSKTKNFKERAYNSMLVTQDLDFEALLKKVKTVDEKNDIYLILGRKDFSNPISSFEKIVATSPNAVQAKVLMARAINQLERDILKLSYGCYYDCKEHGTEKRLPVVTNKETLPFLKQTLQASKKLTTDSNVTDKNYWNLTTAYLYFIQKDYATAKSYLDKVNTTDTMYTAQKNKLALLLTISEQPKITPEFEKTLITEYKDHLTPANDNTYYNRNTTRNFILDILANRYVMQGDIAKSFLLQNDISVLEYGPDLDILNAVEQFYFKKDKNQFEQFVVENIVSMNSYSEITRKGRFETFDFTNYAAIMKGTIYLRKGEFKLAEKELNTATSNPVTNTNFDGYANIPNTIFGYNQIECFECPPNTTMAVDYLEDFKFIPSLMDKQGLAQVLVKLQQLAKKNNKLAAKANYLIGNFFFNTSIYGYYRNVLAYELSNSNNDKFRDFEQKLKMKISSNYYFKDYNWYARYTDDFSIPLTYLDKAIKINKDNELTTKALFTAAKCEQGQYYGTFTDSDETKAIKQKYRDGSLDYKEYQAALVHTKITNYRTYFKELKKYDGTAFYGKVVSNCLYFSSYVDNY